MIDNVKRKFDWLFSSHYKMERFGVTFGVLILCMAILLTTIGIRKKQLDEADMGNIVKYTDSFSMSLSGASGTVEKIFCNDTHTECFVLLHYNDMSNVVTDASEYKMFLTASDVNQRQHELLSNPSATIYMFGMSGYMGIYLVDYAGFPSQIMDLVVRCNKLTGPMPESVPVYEDKSFSNNDQFRIYFNPGAADYEPADFMNMGRMSVYEIFDAMVVKYQEQGVRDALTKSIVDMESAISLINEYSKRLSDAGIIVPPAPMQIRGDEIVTTDDGRKVLSTDYIVQGGYSFDWYHGSVKDGYIAGVLATTENETSILNYIARQRILAQEDRLNFKNMVWLRTDGSEFKLASDTVQSEAMTNIQNNINSLQNAWSSYFELKKNYQTTQMEQLLILEQNLFDTSVNYTVNADPKLLTIW